MDEVAFLLRPRDDGWLVDGTVGMGGHAEALLERSGPEVRLLGLDADPGALRLAGARLARFGDRARLVHANFADLGDVAAAHGLAEARSVLLDLGVSSAQLEESGRGFSFQLDEPLDMRLDPTRGDTAAALLNRLPEVELARLLHEYGEERFARRIARRIVERRGEAAIETTGQLADVVRRAIPRKGYSRIDPATRTFQAIRIWVNRELDGLDGFLGDAARRLARDGRLAVITFHSLEDRVVKHTLRSLQAAGELGLTVRTKRPVVPGEAEIERNPRARSAKLRAAERTDG